MGEPSRWFIEPFTLTDTLRSTTSVVKFPLPCTSDPGPIVDEEVATFCGAEGQTVRAIDTRRQLVAFSRLSSVDIVHWPSKTAMSINTQTDDLEELVSLEHTFLFARIHDTY